MGDTLGRVHGGEGTPLHDAEVRLEPALTAASVARRVVREALEAAHRERWSDAGELAVSEVVTNAALHAHTDIDVRVEVYADRLCVEVRDFNPVLPRQRQYDDHATTGRGMGLVATVALECGIHSLGEDGKIAWFCVGDEEERSVDDLLDAWDLDGWDEPEPTTTPPGHRPVRLEAMPIRLWAAAREYHDALLREFVIYTAARPMIDVSEELAAADRARASVSSVIADLVDDERRSRDAGPGPAPEPLAANQPSLPAELDIEVAVPADAGSLFATLQDLLDFADSLAERGELFVRPALPEIIAVRDWVCEQVIAQLAGSPPAPWGGTAHTRFETFTRRGSVVDVPEWDDDIVREASVGAIAADDSNRIIAVSRPLADLLGWPVDDLVGRRVVTVIPPALRESHVAGFSRHLSTGEAHAIGVPLELPLLRRDGSEVLCSFLLEQAPTRPGRAVYMAWIEALV